MKLKSVLLSFLLLSAIFSIAQNSSLVGTWKLVSGKMTVNDSTTTYGNTGESMKIITPTHFAVMRKDTDGTSLGYAGGTVKMDATNYTETLLFCHNKSMVNKNAVFTYKIEGERWHIVGGVEGYKFDEIWEKVQ